MRHPSLALPVEFHAVPTSVEHGSWCAACQRPSGLSVLIVGTVLLPDGVAVVRRERVWTCRRCARTVTIPEAVRPPG